MKLKGFSAFLTALEMHFRINVHFFSDADAGFHTDQP